jgi:hypothetical protein
MILGHFSQTRTTLKFLFFSLRKHSKKIIYESIQSDVFI